MTSPVKLGPFDYLADACRESPMGRRSPRSPQLIFCALSIANLSHGFRYLRIYENRYRYLKFIHEGGSAALRW